MRKWWLAAAGAGLLVMGNASVAPAAPVDDDRAAVLKALGDTNLDTLSRDPAAASALADRLGVVEPKLQTGEAREHLAVIRLMALLSAGRFDDGLAYALSEVGRTPNKAAPRSFALVFAVAKKEDLRAPGMIEEAARHLTGREREDFTRGLDTDLVWAAWRRVTKDTVRSATLALALQELGWPRTQDLATQDAVKSAILEERVAAGARSQASRLAGELATIASFVDLLAARKYDGVLGGSPHKVMDAQLRRLDRLTAARLQEQPADLERVRDRVSFLASAGRPADAVAVGQPYLRDLRGRMEEGRSTPLFWLANEVAYALVDMGQPAQAVVLIDRLLSLGLAENPELINQAINKIGMLTTLDPVEAAGYAEQLAADHSDLASPYGEMWIWSGIACARLAAGETEAAAPWLTRVRANARNNEAAVVRTSLCANDLDSAAAALIRRLEGDETEEALRYVQTYALAAPPTSEFGKLMQTRSELLLTRPDVAVAIGKVGRRLRLPLAKAS